MSKNSIEDEDIRVTTSKMMIIK